VERELATLAVRPINILKGITGEERGRQNGKVAALLIFI